MQPPRPHEKNSDLNQRYSAQRCLPVQALPLSSASRCAATGHNQVGLN